MTALVFFVLSILYALWIARLVSFGVTTATRIAIATESGAQTLAAIYAALPPEARQRADAAIGRAREAHAREFAAQTAVRFKREKRTGIIALILILAFIALVFAAAVLGYLG